MIFSSNYNFLRCLANVPVTSSVSPTVTLTKSPTPTSTSTHSNQPSHQSSTTTATITSTTSPSITGSITPTPSVSKTQTQQPTPSFTPTATSSNTSSITPTSSVSKTQTAQPTPSFTPTTTSSNTSSITATPSVSKTQTAQSTPSFTLTKSASKTSTTTATPSVSMTQSDQSTPSLTPNTTISPSVTTSINVTASPSISANQTVVFNNVIDGYTEASTDPIKIIVIAVSILIGIVLLIGLSFINCIRKKKPSEASVPLLINEEIEFVNNFKPPGTESSIKSHYWIIIIIGILVDMLGLSLIPNTFLLTIPQTNCEGVGQPKIEFIVTAIFISIAIVSGVMLDFYKKLSKRNKNFTLIRIFKISLFLLLLCRFLEVIYTTLLLFLGDILPYWILYIIGIFSQFSITIIGYTCWNILKIKIASVFKLDPKEETKLINKM